MNKDAELSACASKNDALEVSHVPTGAPPRLSCDKARKIIEHVRRELPVSVKSPASNEFAELWIGWFDPHGLWSAAPDANLGQIIHEDAKDLIMDLELGSGSQAQCHSVERLSRAAKSWVDGLRARFENQRLHTLRRSPRAAFELALRPLFEDDPVQQPAHSLVTEIATNLAVFAHEFPELADDAASSALDRFLPSLSAREWSEVVLAAAVRAYVPAVDPHGEWAPLEEQWSLFGGDPLLDRQPGLWGEMRRTALGVRIVSEPRAPLEVDDLVLAIDGVATAGLSVEQAEQLARLEPEEGKSQRSVRVLRSFELRTLELEIPVADPSMEAERSLDSELIAYGSGNVLVVKLADIADDLGEQLALLLAQTRQAAEPVGVLLDLRGNGGGSTDGAQDVIGLFLPSVPSFPLLHRGRVQEILRSSAPDPSALWLGPVAALVDGYTASAAEMIAGALASYGRGEVIGRHTFGKGCIQEYFEDPVQAGVLRLTTLLVALPSGAPLQRTGIEPTLLLNLPEPSETEAKLERSLLAAAGPDVRDLRAMGGARFPAHGGRIGPCADKIVCTALSRLGEARASGLRRSRNTQNMQPARAHRARSPRTVLGQAEQSVYGSVQSRSGRGPVFGR